MHFTRLNTLISLSTQYKCHPISIFALDTPLRTVKVETMASLVKHKEYEAAARALENAHRTGVD